MPTLSSLIVQREIATMRTVEEAIARQVLHGGDLATNLLEIAAVSEHVLTGLLAESHGLEPAPSGKLPAPAAGVLRTIPGELALRHGIFPLERDARTLVIATFEPLSNAIEEDFTFALDVGIRQLAAPLVRIRQAIAEHYGIPLDRRFLRLLARLEGRPDPSPSSLPPGGRGPGPILLPLPGSVPPATFGSGVIGRVPLVPGPGPVTRTPNVTAPDGPVVMPPIPRGGAAPQIIEGLAPVRLSAEPVDRDPRDGTRLVEVGPPPGSAPEAPSAEPRPMSDRTRVLAGWLRRAMVEDKKARPRMVDATAVASAPSAPEVAARSLARGRRKGPFTAAMAEEELLRATSTDDVLDIYFAFTHQYFQYAVLFAVQGDLAEGRDAAGPGADRARVSGIGVPLDLPSSLATARDRRAPVVAPLAPEGLDGELVRDLGRVAVGSAVIAVIPVVVRHRVVALLYGDDGVDGVELSSIGDALAFTGLVAAALERVILRKKLGGGREADERGRLPWRSGTKASRADPRGRADALARALSQQGPPLESPGEPRVVSPPRVSPGAASVRPSALPSTQPFADAISPAAESTRGPPSSEVDPADVGGPELEEGMIAEEDSGESLNKAIVRAVEAPPPLPPELRFGQVPDKSRQLSELDLMEAGWASATPLPATRTEQQADSDLAALDAEWRTPEPEPVEVAPTPAPGARELLRRGTLRGFGPPIPPPTPAPPPMTQPTSGRDARPAGETSDPPSGRRGPAPPYEGRSRPTPPSSNVGEILPRSPPPNATSIPSPIPARIARARAESLPPEPEPRGEEESSPEPYPLAPPPPTAAAVRPLAHRPIPREEIDEPPESPDASVVLAASEPSPSLHMVPPSSLPQGEPLPSVIVDVAAEYASLIDRLVRGGSGSDEAFAELVKQGEQVLPAIVARFPGPLRVDRHRARDLLPAASQCGPILELLVAMRRTALPFVTVRTTMPDPDIRFWATHVLGELRYPEAANAVLPRLFDDEAAVRRIARRAAASLVGAGAAGQPVLVGLDHLTRNTDEAIPRRVLAIETMGEVRIGPMVPPLVAVLSDASEEVSDTARRALLLITRQDFGRDQKRWTEWWTKNAGRHRVEWLIDALMHEVPSIRRAAGDELKQLTKEYFGYYDDLPKKERERAQGRYREWWEREGRSRSFG